MLKLFISVSLLLWTSVVWDQTLEMGAAEEDAFQGIYDQHAIQIGRGAMVGELGSENIDTHMGRLFLSYTDTIIPGEGGFDLPVLRRYTSLQNRGMQLQRYNTVLGPGWELHFGRIKATLADEFCRVNSLGQTADLNPVFEEADGTAHLMVVADLANQNYDMTTRQRHRITCNSDGTVKVEDRNGMTYFFGKQQYLSNAPVQTSDFQFADTVVNAEHRVVFGSYLHVTEISDRNGNAFTIEYDLRHTSDGTVSRPIFAIRSVRQNGGVVASFGYETPDGGTIDALNSPFAHLERITLTRQPTQQATADGRSLSSVPSLVVQYRVEEEPANGQVRNFNLQRVTTNLSGLGNNMIWRYEYFPEGDGTGPSSMNLSSVTNPFGGVTEYTYKDLQISDPGSIFTSTVAVINTKILQSYGADGTWTYDYSPRGITEIDTTTVDAPEGIRYEYSHCGSDAQNSSNEACQAGFEGYLFEKSTFDDADGVLGPSQNALQIEQYRWEEGEPITNQELKIRVFSSLSNTNNNIAYLPIRSTTTTILRLRPGSAIGNDYDVMSTVRSDFDAFDNARKVEESYTNNDINATDSNVDTSRVRDYEFENRSSSLNSPWLLGLPRREVLVGERLGISESPQNTVKLYDYDSRGNLFTQTINERTSLFDYDGNGNVTKETQPGTNVSIFGNYVLGIPGKVERPDPGILGATTKFLDRTIDRDSGLVVKTDGQVEDNLVATELYAYDALGRVLEIDTPKIETANITFEWGWDVKRSKRGSSIREETYDDYGRVIEIKNFDENAPDNPETTIVVTREFDALGRLEFLTLPHTGNPLSVTRTDFNYDALGRITSETDSADNIPTVYLYNGLTTELTDRRFNTTTYVYRAFGSPSNAELVRIEQPNNVVTTIARTKRGDILQVDQSDIGGGDIVFRRYAYDRLYDLVSEEHPELTGNGGLITYTYDANGNRKTVTRDGRVTTYDYDGRNRLSKIEFPGSGNGILASHKTPDHDYTYYNDNLPRATSRGGNAIEWDYQYDENRNLTNETLSINLPGLSRSYAITYGYDDIDSLSSITYPSSVTAPGTRYERQPDVFGRATQVSGIAYRAKYASNNQLTSAVYASSTPDATQEGISMSITLNKFQLPEHFVSSHPDQASPIIDETYGYDDNFNIDSLTSSIQRNRVFEFDTTNRMTESTVGGIENIYSYDTWSNLYDSYLSDFVPGTFFHDYDLATQRIQESDFYPEFFEAPISYDTQGNIVDTSQFSYAFNDANELIEVSRSDDGGVVAQSQYDAKGYRTIYENDGISRIYVYSHDEQLMHEEIIGQTSLDYLYLGGRLIAKNEYALQLGADSDADGDGINDLMEGISDSDGDGIPDFSDTDSDGDGILDSVEGVGDSDSDGVPDFLDPDDNNNGQLDLDETFIVANECSDFANYDPESGWVLVSEVSDPDTELLPYWFTSRYTVSGDADGDGIPNGQDNDIDGDGISNIDERAAVGMEAVANRTDIDCDGLPHWFDSDADGDTWPDSIEIQVADPDLPGNDDRDTDGLPNYLDTDSDGDGDSDAVDIPFGESIPIGQIPYIEPTLVEEGGVKIARVYATENLIDVVNSRARDIAVLLPPDSDEGSGGPRYIEFQVETDEIGSFTDNSFDGECREIRPPFLGGGGTPGIIGMITVWCPRETETSAVPNRVIHTFRFELNGVTQNLSNLVVVFNVDTLAQGTETPQTNTSGTLEFVEIYPLSVMDYLTNEPIMFDGARVQYIPSVLVPDTDPAPYIRDSQSGDATTTFLVEAGCCSFNDIDYLRTQERSATLYNYHSTGTQVALAYPGFFWDRSDNPFGIAFLGIGDTVDEFYYEIENWQVIFGDLRADPFSSRLLGMLLEVVVPASPTEQGVMRYIQFLDASTGDNPDDPPEFPGLGEVSTASGGTSDLIDSDGDGIRDIFEILNSDYQIDTDADGTPDYLDLDSDEDGISDFDEASAHSLVPIDTDGLGAPDYRDLDADNDGLSDVVETRADPDGDFMGNYVDTDSDNDFVADSIEGRVLLEDGQLADTDGDGIPDSLDQDADGDGLSDFIEAGPDVLSPLDTDGDGIPDFLDTDSDNDGLTDAEELNGVPDSDNDGIPDDYEIAQGLDHNNGADAATDSDGDGLSNLEEFLLGTDINSSDTDADGIPDADEITLGSDPVNDDASIDLDGDGLSVLDEFSNPLTPGNLVYRLNAGGDDIGLIPDVWVGDNNLPGDYGTEGDILTIDSTNPIVIDVGLTGSPPADLFFTYRESSPLTNSLSYALPVVPGDYEVVLYFSEVDTSRFFSNAREFQIAIEDAVVADSVDVYNEVGEFAGFAQEFRVSADGTLNIDLSDIDGNAILSGLTVTVAEAVSEPVDPPEEPTDPVEPQEPSANVALDSVNDWYTPGSGGGFIVNYQVTLTEDDVSSVGSDMWVFEPNYTGSGTIVNSWVSGFGGSTVQGDIASDGDFAIGSNNNGFRPTLSVGETFVFSFQVNNAGFAEADFTPMFTNLTEEPDSDVQGADDVSADFVVANLNSWYNNGSGGYIVVLDVVLTNSLLQDPGDTGWTMQFDYTGGGVVVNGWMNGFPGGVTVTQGDGAAITFSNETQGFQPSIAVGDTLSFSVQVNNAPFDAADFASSFSQ